MGESVSSLMRRGAISARAAAGKPAILRQTRVNRPKEEPFDGKQGRRDQGGADWKNAWDKGDLSVAGTGHIDTRQNMGSPAKASGKPSKGGSAGPQKQPIKKAQIDSPDTQKPDWPKGGSKAKKAKWSTNKRAGPIASNPNQYGDPDGTRKYG
jgi:hypothetical protein